jgi:hypothetical protein
MVHFIKFTKQLIFIFRKKMKVDVIQNQNQLIEEYKGLIKKSSQNY